ncbi:hypothetical protein [Neobacillus sp. SAB-20_R2A]|uniref:hypothetical protein n=1 Tax=Neobacillus sp. SAB-20_R2A TaxID=3120519 RepID=UPI003C6DF456
MNWIPLLKKQKPIFFLGCRGIERYGLFRAFSSPGSVLQQWWPSNMSESPSVAFILYTNPSPDIFFLTNDGEIRRNSGKESTKAVFLPVRPGIIPIGTIFIIPTAIETEQVPIILKQTTWNNVLAEYVWVEGFPYGKNESFLALERLQLERLIHYSRLQVYLVKSGRKFGYSDLGKEEEAIAQAEAFFTGKNISNRIHLVSTPLQQEQLFYLFGGTISYKDELLKRKTDELISSKRYFENFFEIEYEDLLNDLNLVQQLNELFSYDKFQRATSTNPYSLWMNHLDKHLLVNVHDGYINFCMSFINTISISEEDAKARIDTLLHNIWSRLINRLRIYQQETPILPPRIEELDYLLQIKTVKNKMSEDINHILTFKVKNELHSFIEGMYRTWDNLNYESKEARI